MRTAVREETYHHTCRPSPLRLHSIAKGEGTRRHLASVPPVYRGETRTGRKPQELGETVTLPMETTKTGMGVHEIGLVDPADLSPGAEKDDHRREKARIEDKNRTLTRTHLILMVMDQAQAVVLHEEVALTTGSRMWLPEHPMVRWYPPLTRSSSLNRFLNGMGTTTQPSTTFGRSIRLRVSSDGYRALLDFGSRLVW
jgi:hypothetical protein